jgi:hypothetical protein
MTMKVRITKITMPIISIMEKGMMIREVKRVSALAASRTSISGYRLVVIYVWSDDNRMALT